MVQYKTGQRSSVAFWKRQQPELPGVYSADTFRAILQRERARCDRNSHRFCLVFMEDTLGGQAGRRAARHLGELVSERARFTDVVGWVEGNRLGVILTETEKEGAQKFAQDIMSSLNGERKRVASQIIVYPSASDPSNVRDHHDSSPNDKDLPSDGGGAAKSSQQARQRSLSDVGALVARPMPRWKRALDMAGASLGLVMASPILLLSAAVIKITSPGPIFFKQVRVGRGGRRFNCWKLRTMHVNVDTAGHQDQMAGYISSDAPMTKLDNGKDPRLIPFARIMRLTAIDELPQLINVVLGDMSLIGPRPCIPYEAEEFAHWQHQRFDTVPGLTGLWQVSGKNRTTFNEMIRFDISYSRRLSPVRDIWILIKTLPAVAMQVLDARTARP